jgi:hypothetical protein
VFLGRFEAQKQPPRGFSTGWPLPRTPVNKANSESCTISLMGRGSGAPCTGTQRILQAIFDKEIT